MLAQAEKVARRIGSWLYGCYTWAIFAFLLLSFGGLALLSWRVDRTRRLARWFARWMLRLGRMPVSAIALERLPAQPHVLLSNHTSFLDPILLVALLPATPGYAFTTRQQYALQILLWPFIRSMRALVLKHRDESRHTANVDLMRAALERGENLMVFPEGAFAPEPGLRSFHSGAFVAAAQAGAPLVVVGLRGAREALRLGTWMPARRPLTLEVGPTLMPGSDDPSAVHELMLAARAAMLALLPAEERKAEPESR